jgi:REP element-mobilizing transposase RayT
MTLPRQIIPNNTYLVTRRCTKKEFWLKPTPQNKEIFIYCLAMAAQKTGVLVHAVTVMSSHYHAVVYDPKGTLPEFYGYLHQYVAKATNAALGREENLWSTEQTSVVALQMSKDVRDKILYTVCNPVEAHLVAQADNWPGIIAYRPGQTLKAKRPSPYFDEDGDMPKEAELTLTTPHAFLNMRGDDYMKDLRDAIREKEQTIQEEMNRKGQSFLGVAAIMRQKYTDRSHKTDPHGEISPRIACKDKWTRIEVLAKLTGFIVEYKEALEKWKAGKRDVLFPYGTYKMKIHAHVRCKGG